MSKIFRVLQETNLIDLEEFTLLGGVLDLARRLADGDEAERFRRLGIESRIRSERRKPRMVEVLIRLPAPAGDSQRRWAQKLGLIEWTPSEFRAVIPLRSLPDLEIKCREMNYEFTSARGDS
jgi:hypothetical protein